MAQSNNPSLRATLEINMASYDIPNDKPQTPVTQSDDLSLRATLEIQPENRPSLRATLTLNSARKAPVAQSDGSNT